MKILIAEDDTASRAVLVRVLSQNGYEVIETSNGNDAWQVLQQPDSPRLVILDWMMPEMDGPEVVRRVRALQTDRPPHIILLSVRSDKANIITGLEIGANDYLVKPFDPGELLARVDAGSRMVEMQLTLHRYRANAQRIRVENDQQILAMQDALAAKNEELRRLQEDLQVLTARFQALRESTC
jgi:DNA-binding response OmpR family regulator